MRLKNTLFTTLALTFSTLGLGGNERGGGTSPAPVFMPEDVTYQCQVKLTQLNSDLQKPFVSRSTQVFTWKKGDYAGNRGADMKDLQWKHYELIPYGPFHLLQENEIASAPNGATFEGHFTLYSPTARPGGNADLAGLEAGLPMGLSVVAASVDASTRVRTQAENSVFQTLQSRKELKAKTRLNIQGESGNVLKQAILEVNCQRVQ